MSTLDAIRSINAQTSNQSKVLVLADFVLTQPIESWGKSRVGVAFPEINPRLSELRSTLQTVVDIIHQDPFRGDVFTLNTVLMRDLNDLASSTISALSEIQNFGLQGVPSNLETERQSKAKVFNQYAAQLVFFLAPSIREWRKVPDASVESIRSISSQAESLLEDIKNKASTASSIFSREGIAPYISEFTKKVNEANQLSAKWLIVSIVLATITVIAALFLPVSEQTTFNPIFVSSAIAKATTIIVLAFLSAKSVRIYLALRHQKVVYESKALAVSTFQLIAEGANFSIEVKNAVLTEASRSIFSITNSGFISDPENENLLPTVSSLLKG